MVEVETSMAVVENQEVVVAENASMYKIFLILIKFIPVIQMAGMLLNNTFCYYGSTNTIDYVLDFFTGNSTITTIMLIVCSYVFNFCKWHRIIIIANYINITIAYLDICIGLPISDIQLLSLYYIISSISIIYAANIHINNSKNERKVKNIKRSFVRMCG